PEYIRHAGEGGRGAQDRTGEVVAAPEGRTRLGGDEVPGEGPLATVRHGQRAGEGCRTLPEGRAGGGAAAVGVVSPSQDGAAEPDGADRGWGGGRYGSRWNIRGGLAGPTRARRGAGTDRGSETAR